MPFAIRTFVLALILAATPAHAGSLALKGDGGDAWSFARMVEGTASPADCDKVLVASPAGVVAAVPAWGRVSLPPLGAWILQPGEANSL